MIKKKGTTTNTITRAAPDQAMVAPEKYRSGGLGDYYERSTNRWDPGTTITPTRGKVRAGAVQEQIKLNTEYNIYIVLKIEASIQFAPTKHGVKKGNDYSDTSSEWKGEKGTLLDIICFVSH